MFVICDEGVWRVARRTVRKKARAAASSSTRENEERQRPEADKLQPTSERTCKIRIGFDRHNTGAPAWRSDTERVCGRRVGAHRHEKRRAGAVALKQSIIGESAKFGEGVRVRVRAGAPVYSDSWLCFMESKAIRTSRTSRRGLSAYVYFCCFGLSQWVPGRSARPTSHHTPTP